MEDVTFAIVNETQRQIRKRFFRILRTNLANNRRRLFAARPVVMRNRSAWLEQYTTLEEKMGILRCESANLERCQFGI